MNEEVVVRHGMHGVDKRPRELMEQYRKDKEMENTEKHFRPTHGRGFHHSDIHKAAEELRMEGKGSEDPMYESSKKNK